MKFGPEVGFGLKPTPGPNFIKIGVGVRTGLYIRMSRSLVDGLLITFARLQLEQDKFLHISYPKYAVIY